MIFYIGISGKMGSGKDTVAQMISKELTDKGCRTAIIPFALELKKMVMELFQFSKEEVYETKPPKVRKVLQVFGTNVIRERDDSFWIRMLEKNVEKVDNPFGYVFVIVPDVRFYNEAQFIKAKGGLLIRVERDLSNRERTEEEERASLHPSETELDLKSYLFHQSISNHGDLEMLKISVVSALGAITSCNTMKELEIRMENRANR